MRNKKRRGIEKGRVDRSRSVCESSRRATRRATRPRTLANLSFLPAVTVVLRSDDSALCSGYSGASGFSTALRSTGRIGRQGLACSDVSRASNESLRVATIRTSFDPFKHGKHGQTTQCLFKIAQCALEYFVMTKDNTK